MASNTRETLFTTARGGASLFLGALIGYGGRFLVGILLARLLTADQLGLYGLALTTLAALGGITLLGMNLAAIRYSSIVSEKRQLRGLLLVCFGAPTIAGALVGLALWVFPYSVADYFHQPELVPLLGLVAAAIPFGSLLNTAAAASVGFKQTHVSVVAQNLAPSFLKLLLIVALAMGTFTAFQAVLAHVVSLILSCLLGLALVWRIFPLTGERHVDFRSLRDLFSFSLPVHVTQLLSVLDGQVNMLLLGVLKDAHTVGVFIAATAISLASRLLHSSLIQISRPLIAASSQHGKLDELQTLFQTITRWSLTLNMPLLLLLMIYPEQILALLGAGYIEGANALRLLVLGKLIQIAAGPAGTVITMSGHPRLNAVNTLGSLILRISLGLYFIPELGATGAGATALVAILAISLLRLIQTHQMHRIQPYTGQLFKPIAASMLSGALCYFGAGIWNAGSLLGLTALASLLFGTYGFFLLLFGLDQTDRILLKRALLRVLRVPPDDE